VPEQPVDLLEVPVVAAQPVALQAVADEPSDEPALAAVNGHAGDGAKSLGFFA
jgi:hypothetical protein